MLIEPQITLHRICFILLIAKVIFLGYFGHTNRQRVTAVITALTKYNLEEF